MNEVVDALAAIREYTVLQEKLCSALFAKYGPAKDELLLNIPRAGSIELDDVLWSFKRHGLGVLFERFSDRVTVDVHQNISSCPRCVDPWRLLQYLGSRSIRLINVGARIFDSENERALGDMLGELSRLGWVARCDGKNTYEVTDSLIA
ncbi:MULTISPECIES: DUF6896 domain-containing protein [unclassified Bradyrhizobium]|uniref:DUF6896 domain-containing protein n=1 Tax=unclassified Bradyrhizobium TaxID=2631580 RepID=UPI0028E8768B|nr:MULTISPECIES: hypothetical protein [unclassified Bradyrhizobium]